MQKHAQKIGLSNLYKQPQRKQFAQTTYSRKTLEKL